MICRGEREYEDVKTIPFSNPRLNYMTYGGIPCGKFVEFFGAEGGGKTTTALDIIGQAQKLFPDKKAVFVDAENTLDTEWASLLGVNIDDLILITPDNESAEEITQIMIDLIDSGEVSVMVLDSIPHLVSAQQLSKDMAGKTYGGVSGVMTLFAQKIVGKLLKSNTALIFINQVREDMTSPYFRFRTPGGRALKHAYSVRLFLSKGRFIDNECKEIPNSSETPFGNIVEIKVQKTKVFKPDRRMGKYTLKYYTGIDNVTDLVFTAIYLDLIVQAGSWYTFVDPETGEVMEDAMGKSLKFQGSNNVTKFLIDNPEIYEELFDKVYTQSKEIRSVNNDTQVY